MNPQDTQNSQDPNQEYHPKTIYSQPDSPSTQTPTVSDSAAAKSKKSKGPIIAAAITTALVIIVIIVAVVIATTGGKKKTPTVSTDPNDTSAPILQPAKPLELQQTNNAISLDLSAIDDDKDFPANGLEDKTLGL